MYRLLKQLENGEFVHVAFRDGLEQAVQLAESLNDLWPGVYSVRDSHSEVVRLPLSPAPELKHQMSA